MNCEIRKSVKISRNYLHSRVTRFLRQCINKKLRYREEHSASVVRNWCTLWHLSGDNQQINS